MSVARTTNKTQSLFFFGLNHCLHSYPPCSAADQFSHLPWLIFRSWIEQQDNRSVLQRTLTELGPRQTAAPLTFLSENPANMAVFFPLPRPRDLCRPYLATADTLYFLFSYRKLFFHCCFSPVTVSLTALSPACSSFYGHFHQLDNLSVWQHSPAVWPKMVRLHYGSIAVRNFIPSRGKKNKHGWNLTIRLQCAQVTISLLFLLILGLFHPTDLTFNYEVDESRLMTHSVWRTSYLRELLKPGSWSAVSRVEDCYGASSWSMLFLLTFHVFKLNQI